MIVIKRKTDGWPIYVLGPTAENTLADALEVYLGTETLTETQRTLVKLILGYITESR